MQCVPDGWRNLIFPSFTLAKLFPGIQSTTGVNQQSSSHLLHALEQLRIHPLISNLKITDYTEVMIP